jgi:nitrate reductase gamma subunit
MAFFGSILSGLFSGMIGLPEVYGYMWYLHAILTGVFIAYLPFSKLAHMIIAPIVLAMNALAEDEHHQH